MGFLLPSNDAAMMASAAGMAAAWAMSLFESIRANNVSANGLSVYIQTKDSDGSDYGPLASKGEFISMFPDDANALTVEPFSVTDARASFNGPLVATVGVPYFKVTLAVIPFSKDADILDSVMKQSASDPDLCVDLSVCYVRPNPAAMKPFGTFATKTETKVVSFSGGKVIDAALSASVSGPRYSSRQYSFVFSGLDGVNPNVPASKTLSGMWSL